MTKKNSYVAAALLAVGVSVLGAGGVANAQDAEPSATRVGNDCSWTQVIIDPLRDKLGLICRSLEPGYEARAIARPAPGGPIINETPWLQVAPGTTESWGYGTVKGYWLEVEYRKIGG